MNSLVQVNHYFLRHHTPADAPAPVPVTTNPATIALHAIDAAKGGHLVALHLPDADAPVLVHPGEDLGEVTARVADAMPGDDAAPAGDPPPDTAATPRPKWAKKPLIPRED